MSGSGGDDDGVIEFDDALRERLRSNLAAHERRSLIGDRRHAAVALMIVDSDAVADVGVAVRAELADMTDVPEAVDDAGRPLDGDVAGIAGGAALLICLRPSRR